MDTDIAKKVAARFEELPEAVQQAIKSADFDQKMQAVVQKHKLHIDQAGALGDETLMVMMGFLPPTEFAENIEKQLQVSREESEAIAQDISDSLFASIREAMQEYIEGNVLLGTLQESAPAATKTPPPTSRPAPPQALPSASTTTPIPVQKIGPTTPVSAPPASATPPMPVIPATLASAPAPATAPVPAPKPVDVAAEVMLSQPTSSVAPATPQTPHSQAPAEKPIYKADPYREPPE